MQKVHLIIAQILQCTKFAACFSVLLRTIFLSLNIHSLAVYLCINWEHSLDIQ